MNAAQYGALLLCDERLVVTIVRPSECLGLSDFKSAALRLDIGSTEPIPMYPRCMPAGLSAQCSFNRVSRDVWIPWSAIIWAGSRDAYAIVSRQRPAPPAPKPADLITNVVSLCAYRAGRKETR